MFKCTQCEKVFSRKCNKLRHEKLHKITQNDMLKCFYCDLIFTRFDSLVRHCKKSHKQKIEKPNHPKGWQLKSNNDNDCDGCEADDDDCDGDDRKNNLIACNECNIYISKNELKRHMGEASHRRKFVECLENVTVESSAFDSKCIRYKVKNEDEDNLSLELFTNACREKIQKLLENELKIHTATKVQFVIFATFAKYIDETQQQLSQFNFQNKYCEYLQSTEFESFYDEQIGKLENKMTCFNAQGSGWKLQKISHLIVCINKFRFTKARRFLELPREILNRKATINVQNSCNKCFLFALLSGLYYKACKKIKIKPQNLQRTKTYGKMMKLLNWCESDFPMSINAVPSFERKNNISINVFSIEQDEKSKLYSLVGPIHHCKERRKIHINLLYYEDNEINEAHYYFITSLPRLINSDISLNGHKFDVCDGCLLTFRIHDKFLSHIANDECMKRQIILPKEGEFLEFTNFRKQIHVPFTFVADFESILFGDSGADDVEHIPACYCYKILTSITDSHLSELRFCSGKGCEENFIESLLRDTHYIYASYLAPAKQKFDPTPYQAMKKAATQCGICHKPFTEQNDKDGNYKVVDHSHLTGKYRCISHRICNLQFQV
jgi:uncharacterized C2H2 Zn-finger protein